MGYSIDYNNFTSIFVVPAHVTDKCLRACSGIALKVLLLVLRHQEEPIQIANLAKQLGTPLGDVKEALDYWTNEGILREKAQPQDYLPKDNPAYEQQPLPQVFKTDVVAEPAEPTTKEETIIPDRKPIVQAVRAITAHKNMTIGEIESLSHTDHRIAELAEAVQGVLGRPLSRTELETIISFYTYSGLPPEYILLVCAHCVSMGRTNVRAITKTLNEMMSEGIETYEQAETYLERWSQRGNNESLTKSAFGIFDRRLTTQERKFIDIWFNTFKFDIAMIKLAYERTIDNIGKLSFNYVNSILASWHSKGISSTKEAALEASPKSTGKGSQGKYTGNKNAGIKSSIDMDELQHFITFGKGKDE